MAKYIAVHALSLPNPGAPDDPLRSILHRAGAVVELEGASAEAALKGGAIRELTKEERGDSPSPEQELADSREQAELQALRDAAKDRPNNNASKEEWRAFAQRIGVQVPDDAKREDIVTAVDARLALAKQQ